MQKLDIAIVILVLYLGLSAWAYRDVAVKKPASRALPDTHPKKAARTHASYAQVALSVVAICLGSILIVSGAGLVARGLSGTSEWTALTLGPAMPVSDLVTGVVMLLLGSLVVYETRYSVIRHPRPPRRMTGRPA